MRKFGLYSQATFLAGKRVVPLPDTWFASDPGFARLQCILHRWMAHCHRVILTLLPARTQGISSIATFYLLKFASALTMLSLPKLPLSNAVSRVARYQYRSERCPGRVWG